MSSNRSDYSKSMRMIITGVSLFSGFCFTLMVFAYIDNIFFGNELSVYLSNRLGRFMIGFIMIPIFGGGAYITYWATRSNTSFFDAYREKLGIQDNAGTQQFAASGTMRNVQELAKEDNAFNRLLHRFYGYLRSISGSGKFGERQALDLNSRIGGSSMAQIVQISFGILLFICVLTGTNAYVNRVYGVEFNVVLNAARVERPTIALSIIALCGLSLLLLLFKYIRRMVEKVLVPVMNLGGSMLSTEKIDPWAINHPAFLRDTHLQIHFPWRAYLYPVVAVCSALPLAIGIILFNAELIAAGSAGCIVGLLLNHFDSGQRDWFRFVDSNTLEVGKGFKKIRLQLSEIDDVVVHYQSIKDRSIWLSSETAFMRSLITQKVMGELFNGPELIPSTITFFNTEGDGYAIPLRFMTRNGKEVHSHEIEFFFAYWLKSHGFQFELAGSDEDAGDWRAFRKG
ncbi:MAG: hypothetical protein ACOYPR_19400 [Saprospiraceae bacterium]